ncbi:MAG: uncharacterized protein QG622_257, partial [Actinomycetota bacterium]|nr:uncharacterized protein [Actinomycetota bacterium]
MLPKVLKAAVARIATHVTDHGLASITVILHGGEPLLAGPDRLRRIIEEVRSLESTGVGLELAIQTNGLLLDRTFLDLFLHHQVKVGISLDGTARAHDRRRRRPDGRGSHSGVDRAIKELSGPSYRSLFSGLLGVIDLDEDPVAYYEEMIKYGPPRIDLLLPHGTWTVPPPGRIPGDESTPYGDWLVAVFDRWYSAPRRETGIQVFESVI